LPNRTGAESMTRSLPSAAVWATPAARPSTSRMISVTVRPVRTQPPVVNKPAKDVVNEPISADLKKVMRQLKLSPMLT